MKHVLACLLLLLVVAACSDGDSMRRQLRELQARNQADSLMTDLNQATTLCDYFDRHGTPNERMLAHYLLGRTHADLGEAPEALQAFHDAADCADTTASDCDYRLLTRVYAQTASLFYEQQMPYEMLEELDLMRRTAEKGNDTLSRISAIEWKSVAYDYLDKKLESVGLLRESYHAYMNSGHQQMAMNCVPNIIDHLVELNQLEGARKWIDIYEGYISKLQTDIQSSCPAFYYYYKGKYYYSTCKYDLSQVVLERFLQYAQTPNDLEAAYSALYKLYEKIGNADSIAKYAALSYQTSNERYRASNSEELHHMHALYNYSRNQIIAHKKTEETAQLHFLLLLGLFVFIVIVAFILIAFWLYKRKKKEELLRVMQEYQHEIELQEQAQFDIIQLKEQEISTLISQKESEIAERQNLIDQYHQVIAQEAPLDGRFLETIEYKRFRYLCTHPLEKVTAKDWKSLQDMFNRYLPDFYIKVNTPRHLKDIDYRICMLIRLHFAYSEIGMLTNTSPQYIYGRRIQLLNKIFNIKGKAEEFDKLLRMVK